MEKCHFFCDSEQPRKTSHFHEFECDCEFSGLATDMAKQYFAVSGGGLVKVDIEFDTDDPVDVCVVKHRDHRTRRS
jgi:hypothetical protein